VDAGLINVLILIVFIVAKKLGKNLSDPADNVWLANPKRYLSLNFFIVYQILMGHVLVLIHAVTIHISHFPHFFHS
jgi:hypothetical protein